MLCAALFQEFAVGCSDVLRRTIKAYVFGARKSARAHEPVAVSFSELATVSARQVERVARTTAWSQRIVSGSILPCQRLFQTSVDPGWQARSGARV